MRIYLGELVKAFCKKTTVAIFIALTVLNGVLLWVNESQKNDTYTTALYKAAFSDLEGLTAWQAYEQVSLQLQKLQLTDRLSYGEDISETLKEYPEIDGEQLINDYKSKSYLKYTNDSFYEQQLLKDVLAEVESCAKYDEYLTGIDEAAAKMTAISLFADPDSFSFKNIVKTPEDFAHLKGSQLEIAPSKGVSMAADFLATDLIALLMIMTVVVTIVTREKELNQIVLSRTAFKGRKTLGAAKLFTCFAAALIAETILYAVNFTISYFTYGFGDLSRQIQSVYDFNGSNLKISVLEFFILFLIAKLAVYCVFAGFIYLVTVISNTAVKVYGILAVTIAAEAVMYYTIPSASYLCPFKYINILAYANTKDLFSSYLNLNLFGEPVNYIAVFVISAAVLLIGFSAISVLVFSKQRVLKSRSKKFSLEKINIFKGRTTNLFLQECYKIFIGGKALIILAVFAAVVGLTYEPEKEKFTSVDEIYYKQYMLKLEGEYTPQKQKMIDDEEEKFAEAQIKMLEELANTDGDGIFIMMKYQDILAPQYAFEQVKQHAEYLKTTENGEFVYDSGYKLLTGDKSAGNKDLTLGLTAMAMVICCLVYVYSIEYQTGANVLLKTSAKGRVDTFLRKFTIGLIIVTIIYVLTYAPYFYNVLNAYGTRGIDAPICSLEAFSDWDMSIKAYLILISVARYISLICAMLIIYFLSSRLKSVIGAFLAGTAVLVLPILLSLLGIKFFDYVLLNPILIGNL
ncbi:hypothetical protein [Ruminococcus sp. Marseille-P6503]|uniref:hypothetical protein n=1 Tax=Ruminococcus sp. Marseille-P6503 TaxID=2364796 RepID=UPI000F535E01|nr:hypothetical protein [Ruminococcus sp. Marseille-P6503]